MVGPPDVATSINASTAACYFLDPVLGFRKLGYVIASVLALLPTCAGEFFATKFA